MAKITIRFKPRTKPDFHSSDTHLFSEISQILSVLIPEHSSQPQDHLLCAVNGKSFLPLTEAILVSLL